MTNSKSRKVTKPNGEKVVVTYVKHLTLDQRGALISQIVDSAFVDTEAQTKFYAPFVVDAAALYYGIQAYTNYDLGNIDLNTFWGEECDSKFYSKLLTSCTDEFGDVVKIAWDMIHTEARRSRIDDIIDDADALIAQFKDASLEDIVSAIVSLADKKGISPTAK